MSAAVAVSLPTIPGIRRRVQAATGRGAAREETLAGAAGPAVRVPVPAAVAV